MTLIGLLLLLIQVLVSTSLLYHYLLLIAGGRPHRSAADGGNPAGFLRFAVVLPAHNEESVIGASVARLRQMDYPDDRFDVHVAADHCTDGTASVARSSGAVVDERAEEPRGRKGYVLAWALARLLDDPRGYDAVVVFDADSQVAPGFLRLMNQALAGDAQVLQGRHVITNPYASIFSTLADADMRLNNRIRNQAKENLGLSARLMGDGMCFRREILEAHPFDASSLTEDREYGIYLVTQGERVRFVPEALSTGQATARWKDATGQRLRWYGGAFDLQKRYLRPLLEAAWRDRSFRALDIALELSVLPFSALSMLAVGLLAIQGFLAVLGLGPSLAYSATLALMALLYPFFGLMAERAPGKSYLALIYGPVYMAWRVWLGLVVRLRRGQVPWIRTRRAEEGNRPT